MAESAAEQNSVEERLAELERQFSTLQAHLVGAKAREKDWRRTVGMMPDDELSREAARRGREWREKANAE
jgi:hypothetical protein